MIIYHFMQFIYILLRSNQPLNNEFQFKSAKPVPEEYNKFIRSIYIPFIAQCIVRFYFETPSNFGYICRL